MWARGAVATSKMWMVEQDQQQVAGMPPMEKAGTAAQNNPGKEAPSNGPHPVEGVPGQVSVPRAVGPTSQNVFSNLQGLLAAIKDLGSAVAVALEEIYSSFPPAGRVQHCPFIYPWVLYLWQSFDVCLPDCPILRSVCLSLSVLFHHRHPGCVTL